MGYIRMTNADGPVTRLGRLSLAGEVRDAEPVMPRRIRVLDEFVVSVVTAGRGEYREAMDGPVQPVAPGSITVVPPGQPHWYGTRPGERWTEWFAIVDGPLIRTLAETGVLTVGGPRPLAPATTTTTLGFLLDAVPTGQAAAEHQLLGLADWLAAACRTDGGEDDRWARAAGLLVADFTAGLSVPDVAAALGWGYDEFRRGFAVVFGVPPLAYRNARRAEASAGLLRLTSLTTRQIAGRLGYTDEFHFSRAFRRHFGVAPSHYRRSQQASGSASTTAQQ